MDAITDGIVSHNNVQYVCRAGRFLISTLLRLDAEKYKSLMIIADLKQDEMLARSFAASLDPSIMRHGLDLINQLPHLTDEERNRFEMAVGDEQ
jgi:hypothetical protein